MKYTIRNIIEMKSKYYCVLRHHKIQESHRYLYERNIFIKISLRAKNIFSSLIRFFILSVFIPRR